MNLRSIFQWIILSGLGISGVGLAADQLEDVATGLEYLNQHLDSLLTLQIDCDTGSKATEKNTLEKCEFMKRRADIPGLRENWSLDATGADLFRHHPAVLKADYRKNTLAIPDTGLRIQGNPEADSALLGVSPERDYDIHGTHVVSIAASRKYGVNPSLPVRPLPVIHRSQGMFTPEGFDTEDLLKQVLVAAHDPDVSVINLSISANENAALQSALREAIQAGKWVVQAAGNEGAVNDRSRAGLDAFADTPEVFTVGWLSAFGAPGYKSNFGPEVRYFAPGSTIQGLHAKFSPNLVKSNASVSLNGTSMASPFFASVLATLRAVAPNLTSQEAELVLNLSAISRGPKPGIRQVNPYHAVTLLELGQECVKHTKSTLSECIPKTERAILARAEAWEIEPPRGSSSCFAWQIYYDQLRKKYFLTNGGKSASEELEKFFMEKDPNIGHERSYFAHPPELLRSSSPSPQSTGRPADNDPGKLFLLLRDPESMRSDLSVAARFYSGRMNAEKSAVNLESLRTTDPERFLQLMPAKPENVDAFLSVCSAFLYAGEKSPQGCSRYLYDAPKPFRLTAARALIQQGKPLAVMDPVVMLQDESDTEGKKLYQGLLSLTAKGWKIRADVNEFEKYFPRWADFSLSDRAQVVDDFNRLRAAGQLNLKHSWKSEDYSSRDLDQIEAWASLGLPPDRIRGRETRLRDLTAPSGGNRKFAPEIAEFVYQGRRARYGYPDRDRFMAAFQGALSRADVWVKDPKGKHEFNVSEFGDDAFNSVAVREASKDPELAVRIADVLSDPVNLKRYSVMAEFGWYIKEVLPTLPLSSRDKLVTSILDAARKDPQLLHRYGFDPASRIGNFLNATQSSTVSQALLKQISEKPQDDPLYQSVRVSELLNEARAINAPASAVHQYLAEVPGGVNEHLGDISLDNLAKDPELLARWKSRLAHPPRVKDGLDETLMQVLHSSEQTFHQVSDAVAENFANLLKGIQYTGLSNLENLAYGFAHYEGNSDFKIGTLFKQMQIAIQDRDFMTPPGGFDYDRNGRSGKGIVWMTQKLALSKAGDRYLNSHPEFSAQLAKWMASVDPEEFLYPRNEGLPLPLIRALGAELPQKLTPTGKYNRLSDWHAEVISNLPEYLPRALAAYRAADTLTPNDGDRTPRFKRDLFSAIEKLLARHPEAASKVLNSEFADEALQILAQQSILSTSNRGGIHE